MGIGTNFASTKVSSVEGAPVRGGRSIYGYAVTLWRGAGAWLGWLLGKRTAARTPERRQWPRYHSAVGTHFQPVAGAEGERLPAAVGDISPGGVSLLVGRRLEPGALVHVALPGRAANLLACVLHIRDVRDSRWSLGCSFIRELSEEELATFRPARARTGEPGASAPGGVMPSGG
jgi:hypothetical protein